MCVCVLKKVNIKLVKKKLTASFYFYLLNSSNIFFCWQGPHEHDTRPWECSLVVKWFSTCQQLVSWLVKICTKSIAEWLKKMTSLILSYIITDTWWVVFLMVVKLLFFPVTCAFLSELWTLKTKNWHENLIFIYFLRIKKV